MVLLEKVRIIQTVKKFSDFYETQKFVTTFTRARNKPISILSQILQYTQFLSQHILLQPPFQCFPRGLFLSSSPNMTL
jgi:hypothetical protein